MEGPVTMATAATLDQILIRTEPRSFTPPGDPTARLAHLDPRPLWREDAVIESPWRSPTFWVAYALVAPVAGIVKLLKR